MDSGDDCDSGIWSNAFQTCVEEEGEMHADPICHELCDDESSESTPDPICDKGPEETAMDEQPLVLVGQESMNVL